MHWQVMFSNLQAVVAVFVDDLDISPVEEPDDVKHDQHLGLVTRHSPEEILETLLVRQLRARAPITHL